MNKLKGKRNGMVSCQIIIKVISLDDFQFVSEAGAHPSSVPRNTSPQTQYLEGQGIIHISKHESTSWVLSPLVATPLLYPPLSSTSKANRSLHPYDNNLLYTSP